MKKTLNTTDLVFILDRSGSMSGLESDTIGGYNAMLEKQKGGDVRVTTVLFDNTIDTLYEQTPIEKVPKMTEKEYYVKGCTALLDAVGSTIKRISKLHKQGNRPEKTLFVITTDGLENASREYTYDKVKAIIEKKKEKYNWEFLFLGANIDAAAEAGKMGICADKAVKFKCDSKGTALNFSVLAKTVGAFAKPCGKISDDWKEAIEEYCEEP